MADFNDFNDLSAFPQDFQRTIHYLRRQLQAFAWLHTLWKKITVVLELGCGHTKRGKTMNLLKSFSGGEKACDWFDAVFSSATRRSATHLAHCILLASLALLLSSIAFAQRDLGTITGTVTDSSGGAVAGATITITETSTGQIFKLDTAAGGDYTRPALQPGTYTVTAVAAGFQGVTQQNVVVTAGSRVGIDLTLQVGAVNQAVAVNAEAPLLQTESTELGAHLDSNAVAELPLGGQRVFTYLARLSPGVVPGESNRDANTGAMSVDGVRSLGQNNYLLNGVDNNVNVIDFLNGASFVIGPPPEAIGELQVLTTGYNAEYGRAAGGVINVDLRSGTNQLHGGLWEVFQNEALNANSWQNNNVGAPKPIFRQNQFGAAAGGPVIRNKLFIFGDYQGTRISDVNRAGFITIPTPAEIHGDFSRLLTATVIGTDALGRKIFQGAIYDPTTQRTVGGQLVRDPFPGNIIPSNRWDAAAAKMLALWPAPNQTVSATGYPQNDEFFSSPGKNSTDSGDLRIDYRLSEKNSFYGSMSINDNTTSSKQVFAQGLGSAGFTGGDTQATYTKNFQVGYTRVWSPTIVSESRVGITRLSTSIIGPDGNAGDLYKTFGIGGFDPTSDTAQNGGLPGINVRDGTPYQSFGAGGYQPMTMHSNVVDLIQNVAVSKGAHAFKFGAELRLVHYPFIQVSDPHGDFNATRSSTAYPSGALSNSTGDPIASFLLGVLDSGTISTTNESTSAKRTWAFYAQDDWKVNRKLTVNIGLRYEFFSPTYATNGHQSNFDFANSTLYIPPGPDQNSPLPPNFATSYPNVTVSRGQVNKYMFPWDKTDIGPRIGFAYRLQEKTVIRAGFGIFYGGEENLGGDGNLGLAPPFNTTINLINTSPTAPFGINPFLPGGFSAGFPANVFNLPAPVVFTGIATDFRSPAVQKWNVAVQRELPGSVALELAYVGNHQIHQIALDTANACPNSGSAAAIANPTAYCNAARPVANIGPGRVTNTNGVGNYNALSVKAEKHLSNGLEFISAYTWSHAISDTCTPLTYPNGCSGPGSGGLIYRGSPDPENQRSGYANALWDIRHNFTTGFTYQLPVGNGRMYGSNLSPVANAFVGGWQLGGILTIRTGVPLSLSYGGCQGEWAICLPDVVHGMDANGAPAGGRSAAKWFNTAAVVPAAAGTGGDAGTFNISAPGNSTLDGSLFKTFNITERFNMEFRAEAFNLFNKTQLGTPDTNLQDSTFGQITSSSGERHIQFSLRLHF
jgi:hypothetical protein